MRDNIMRTQKLHCNCVDMLMCHLLKFSCRAVLWAVIKDFAMTRAQ